MNKIVAFTLEGIGVCTILQWVYKVGKNEGKKDVVLQITHGTDEFYKESIELFEKAREANKKEESKN